MTHDHSTEQPYSSLYYCLLAIIALLPFPHGGELFWEHAPFISSIFLLLSIWLFQQWHYNRTLPHIINTNKIPLILLCIWLMYTYIQTLSLPITWLTFLNPAAAKLNTYTSINGASHTNSLSIEASISSIELLRYSSYVAMFFLLLVLCNTYKRIKHLAFIIFMVGVVQALYSLLNYYTAGQFSINEPIPPWGTPWNEATRGTYTHRNHFAALMAMTIPIGIGIIMSAKEQSNEKRHLEKILSFVMSSRALYIVFLCVMLIALLFSASRGGNGAFLAAFILTLSLFLLFQGRKYKSLSFLPVMATVITIVILLFGIGSLADRFEKYGFSANGRDHMLTTAYSLSQDYPLTGSGAGTYPYIFHQYKNPELGTSSMSKRVHNDYLELFTDQGVIGLTLLGSSIFLFIITIIKGIKKRSNPKMASLFFGSIFGISAMLIHSAVEFNFHIPANASYFFILLAIALISSNRQHQ